MRKKSELIYIMNPLCGWCKKADPIIEELKKDGYSITTLDMGNKEDAKKASEIKAKYNLQCGTPQFIDAESGNNVCGLREKDVLEKWAKGEVIPEAPQRPRPNFQPHASVNIEIKNFNLSVWQEATQILRDKFFNEYEIWKESRSKRIKDRPEFPTTDQIYAESVKILSFCSSK